MNKFKSLAIAVSITAAFSLGVFADDAIDTITAQLHKDITVTVDGGSLIAMDALGVPIYPITYNNNLYLPANALATMLNATPAWDDVTRTLTITSNINAPDQSSMTYSTAKSLEGKAVYWAPTGNKMHANAKCKSFQLGIAYVGTLEQAKAVRTDGWCGICAKGVDDLNYTAHTYSGFSDIEKCYTYEDYIAGKPVLVPAE